MIYALIIFIGAAMFFCGITLGLLFPCGIEKTVKKSNFKRDKKTSSENISEVRNFLNYDGSPQP